MVRTSDLYKCAYLVMNGLNIKKLEVTGHNGKSSVHFIFNSAKAEKLNKEFITGRAVVNITDLKLTMIHLKDLMFDKIRAASRQGGRKKNEKWRKREQIISSL